MVVIIGMFSSVRGARPLLEDFGGANDGISMYEMARNNLAYWLQRLASGPSDGGATFSNVSAMRLLSEDFNGVKDDFSKYNSHVYEIAKHNLAYWVQRLSSGPSDGGAGH
ncbi:hypothetical protein Ancab_008447 [Ancistrocladus abbreviatus]